MRIAIRCWKISHVSKSNSVESLLKPAAWFLTPHQRGNPHTVLDSRHGDETAWSAGNEVQALVHGVTYFRELLLRVERMEAGDLLLFTDWRGDPDELLDGPGTQVGPVLASASLRGVDVRGLVWRSHLDRFKFSARENRHLGAEIEAAGGECLLDMRVRAKGSHHQKLVVLRHPGRPELDIAFVGGIDLCHGRRDDELHHGDPQAEPMARVYGDRPPWHDVQLAIRGPAVGDVETVFRERWEDPAPLTRNPIDVLSERMRGEDRRGRALPVQLPDPWPCGPNSVQLLRTYPVRHPGYPFAPRGERSVARGYAKALSKARSLIYLEDQYLWSADVARIFAKPLKSNPQLRMIVVIPLHPDEDGRFAGPPNLIGRRHAMRLLARAGGDRFAVYGLENEAGSPVYVHAKLCVIDDLWACVGSDNANRRSWTHDSELSCAVLGPDSGVAGSSWAHSLRLKLAREHLGSESDIAGMAELDAAAFFDEFARSAALLDGWHARGCSGPKPPGQLRRYDPPRLHPVTRFWATPFYRLLYDPDGRTPWKRFTHRF
jgi:phosphatidylserine/phosphatidylglycerophosphate/cardiolipin synthase-like enzyme